MNVESKLKLRLWALLFAAFLVLTFIVGLIYALAIGICAFLVWKAYSQVKLMRWWTNESPITRKIIEHEAHKLNEGKESKSLWIQSLTTPEVQEQAKNYRLEIMARPIVIEKQSSDLIEGWTVWGASRLEECVLRHDVEKLLEDNVGTPENPISMLQVLISKAAFEITITEHALSLLGVANPRQVLSQRMVADHLSERKSEMDIVWLAKGEARGAALKLLARELGE